MNIRLTYLKWSLQLPSGGRMSQKATSSLISGPSQTQPHPSLLWPGDSARAHIFGDVSNG